MSKKSEYEKPSIGDGVRKLKADKLVLSDTLRNMIELVEMYLDIQGGCDHDNDVCGCDQFRRLQRAKQVLVEHGAEPQYCEEGCDGKATIPYCLNCGEGEEECRHPNQNDKRIVYGLPCPDCGEILRKGVRL